MTVNVLTIDNNNVIKLTSKKKQTMDTYYKIDKPQKYYAY